MEENKEIKKEKSLSEADLERLELLQKSDERTGKQLTINIETGNLEEIDELKQLINKDFENPGEKYQIYYNGIRRLLMNYLPKGKHNLDLRKIIYDEKNVFLNLGKKKSDNKGVRKSDGRMTYQPIMKEILDIILEWISNSQNPFVLYKDLYNLNEKHGYGHEVYKKYTEEFAKAMMDFAENQ